MYPERLWCVWELCTLFSFSSVEHAVKRIILRGVDEEPEKLKRQLMNFRLANAHCYDPNEETRLRRIIGAVGESEFNNRIHAFAEALNHA